MEILLQTGVATMGVCVAAALMRALTRRRDRTIEAGAVSRGWLAEHRGRRREFGSYD
jgi:hypothetical protein